MDIWLSTARGPSEHGCPFHASGSKVDEGSSRGILPLIMAGSVDTLELVRASGSAPAPPLGQGGTGSTGGRRPPRCLLEVLQRTRTACGGRLLRACLLQVCEGGRSLGELGCTMLPRLGYKCCCNARCFACCNCLFECCCSRSPTSRRWTCGMIACRWVRLGDGAGGCRGGREPWDWTCLCRRSEGLRRRERGAACG